MYNESFKQIYLSIYRQIVHRRLQTTRFSRMRPKSQKVPTSDPIFNGIFPVRLFLTENIFLNFRFIYFLIPCEKTKIPPFSDLRLIREKPVVWGLRCTICHIFTCNERGIKIKFCFTHMYMRIVVIRCHPFLALNYQWKS